MKKLFWSVLALGLLGLPAMAEEECSHPYGECTGECWKCGATGVTITGEVNHFINGNWQHMMPTIGGWCLWRGVCE